MARCRILPLRSKRLTLVVRGRALVDGVSLPARRGRRTVILGPNGAGKSLTLRLCHGLLQPTSGAVRWNGAVPAAAAGGTPWSSSGRCMLRRSALANLVHALGLGGAAARASAKRAARGRSSASAWPRWPRGRRGVLSGGEQQRLAMARAWALRAGGAVPRRADRRRSIPAATRADRGDDRGLPCRRHDDRDDDARPRPGPAPRRRGAVPASRPAPRARRRPTSSSTRPRSRSARAFLKGELLVVSLTAQREK